jgi:WD40 repeat protein
MSALLTTGALGLGWWARDLVRPTPSPAPLARFTWSLPVGLVLTSAPAISPDGQRLAFTASENGARPRLFMRPLGSLEPLAIPQTDGAKQPFWSPESLSLGYFAGGKLMRVGVSGGSPVEICAAPDGRGGTWNQNGTIVFSPDLIHAGLMRVPAAGGTPEPVTRLDGERGENSHRWPAFLPDGTHFVYFVRSLQAERRGVYLGRLDRPADTPGVLLFRSESEAFFAPTDGRNRGVLLSVADGHVEARTFDTRRLALVGDPARVPLQAGGNTPHHGAMLSASGDTLVHLAEAMPYGSRMASVLRTGADLTRDPVRAVVNWPRVSPDGTRLAIQRLDAVTGGADVWVEDLERGTWLRVTREGSSAQLPVWSPDSSRLAYVAGPFLAPRVAVAAADGTGEVADLPCPAFRCEPSDWSRDGRWIVVNALDEKTAGSDVWMVPVQAGGTPRPLLTAPFVERDARLSPDGSLVAYVSEETGRPEISVRALEGEPRRQVLSAGGGSQPVWRRDGSELLFVDPEGVLRAIAVRRAADGRPVLGRATPVNVPPLGAGHYSTQYDLSPDGRRLYFLDRQPGNPPRDIGVVLGWRALLRP